MRGESSPAYTSPWFPGCAERIANVIPRARLIYCVRDPILRTISHYRLGRAYGYDSRPIDEALSRPDGYYTERSRYGAAVARYRRLFGSEQILVIDAADLDRRRRATLREVYSFVGVDPDFWSPRLDRRWNSGGRHGGARWRAFARARRLSVWSQLASFPPRRGLWWLERLGSGSDRETPLERPSPDTVERLADFLTEDAAQLRELTGQSFGEWPV